MSRYEITGSYTGTVICGWDPGLNTFFLDGFGEWFGTTYGEWSEPRRLIRYARRRDASPPWGMTWRTFIKQLQQDQAENPGLDASHPIGILKITLGQFQGTAEQGAALADLKWTETLGGRFSLFRRRLEVRADQRALEKYQPRASQLGLAALALTGLALAPHSVAGTVVFWIGALPAGFRFIQRRIE